MAIATPTGITFLDSSGTRSLYAFHGLVNNHAYALGVSGDAANQQLMVGTLGGMSVLQAGVVRANYTTANSGLKHNWITALAPVGDEWFAGTYGAGVLRMTDRGNWEIFADMPADVVVNPNALLVTPSHVFAGLLGGVFGSSTANASAGCLSSPGCHRSTSPRWLRTMEICSSAPTTVWCG